MTQEHFTFLTGAGMTKITVDVPEKFLTSPELRQAFSEGAGAGAAAMLDELMPDTTPFPE